MSQWRNKVKEHLASTANLQFITGRNKVLEHLSATANLQVQKGQVPKTLATLEALYVYAMWVDIKFCMVVVEAFAQLTRGNTEEAEKIVPLI